MYTETVKKALFMRIPLQEIAEPAWIADSIVFLASEKARYHRSDNNDRWWVCDGWQLAGSRVLEIVGKAVCPHSEKLAAPT